MALLRTDETLISKNLSQKDVQLMVSCTNGLDPEKIEICRLLRQARALEDSEEICLVIKRKASPVAQVKSVWQKFSAPFFFAMSGNLSRMAVQNFPKFKTEKWNAMTSGMTRTVKLSG